MNPLSLLFAGLVVVACLVCLTVLALHGLIPATSVSALASTLVGGVLGLLSPQMLSSTRVAQGIVSTVEKVS